MGHPLGSEADQMTVTVREALQALLGRKRSGDYKADLVEAAREAMERRKNNSDHGGAIIAALRDNVGMTWREIEDATGIPRTTAFRWADPPPEHPSGGRTDLPDDELPIDDPV